MTETVDWQIAREGVRIARENGVNLPVELALALLHAQVHREGGALDAIDHADEEERLARNIADEATDPDSPSVSASTLHVRVVRNLEQSQQQVDASESDRNAAAAHSVQTVLQCSVVAGSPSERADADAAIDAMVQHVQESEPVDFTSSNSKKQEGISAVQSVMPHHTLLSFFQQENAPKEQQLYELAAIVHGIAIFNHARGVGTGCLVDDVDNAVTSGRTMVHRLQELLRTAQHQIQRYRCVIDWKSESRSPDEDDMVRLRDEMLHYVHLKKLGQDLLQTVERQLFSVRSLQDQVAELSAQALSLAARSNGVQKSRIYQEFIRMAQTRRKLVSEAESLILNEKSVTLLLQYSTDQSFTRTLRRRDEQLARHRRGTPLELERLPRVTSLDNSAPGVEKSTGAVQRTLALGGLDPLVLAARYGLPAFADSSVEQVEWNGRAYGFSSIANARRFAAAPAEWLELAKDAIGNAAPLAMLCSDDEECGFDVRKALQVAQQGPNRVDASSQTPTHFIERNMDHTYEWNEWELRRKALQLANIKERKTTSAQTVLNNFRRDNEAQVWLPKDAAVNTTSSKGTTMPIPKRYLQNLRGDPNKRLNTVDLTIDLGQPR